MCDKLITWIERLLKNQKLKENISGTLKDLLSLTRWPFLSIAVIGSEMAKFKASRFVLSGSVAFNVVKTVPIGVSSVTSARCVSGVKYGALSLLFSTSIISVVVPVRLGVPEIKKQVCCVKK